jgi:hypothetical protein
VDTGRSDRLDSAPYTRFAMQRRYLSWVLALLLVLAQHGAVLHELSHFGHSADGVSLRQDSGVSEGASCPTCQAFSQVANPAGSYSLELGVVPQSLNPTAEPAYSITAADVPSARSRGPPPA